MYSMYRNSGLKEFAMVVFGYSLGKTNMTKTVENTFNVSFWRDLFWTITIGQLISFPLGPALTIT